MHAAWPGRRPAWSAILSAATMLRSRCIALFDTFDRVPTEAAHSCGRHGTGSRRERRSRKRRGMLGSGSVQIRARDDAPPGGRSLAARTPAQPHASGPTLSPVRAQAGTAANRSCRRWRDAVLLRTAHRTPRRLHACLCSILMHHAPPRTGSVRDSWRRLRSRGPRACPRRISVHIALPGTIGELRQHGGRQHCACGRDCLSRSCGAPRGRGLCSNAGRRAAHARLSARCGAYLLRHIDSMRGSERGRRETRRMKCC